MLALLVRAGQAGGTLTVDRKGQFGRVLAVPLSLRVNYVSYFIYKRPTIMQLKGSRSFTDAVCEWPCPCSTLSVL